jgi:hypothetical protein
MPREITLTLRFFANLIGALAAREEEEEMEGCLLVLQTKILQLNNLDEPPAPIQIDDRYEGNNNACCGSASSS